ncbi:putative GATA transcription factor 22 [Impatiens glandulifera]|uniref:putative GATA transcription factor 22 n=1 Tax=Impatiens glandulifera TaxID=253017 RepID=UPI001FB0F991|nr:putative GATA transcription factor 22 [Impatiens glandulifera]
MASSMNPNFINLSLSLLPHDQHQQQLQLSLGQDSSSSSSSLSLQPYVNVPLQEFHQEAYNPLLQDPKELDSLVSLGPSIEDRPVVVENEAHRGLKISLWKRGDKDDHGSPKWVPSKIRLMGRMVGSNRTESQSGKNVAKAKLIEGDQKRRSSNSIENDHSLINNNITTPIRVCADCNTTKTPLWRSGPRGPKSLCNACGIRQRKARRAMAAAAAAATTANCASLEVANSSVKIKKPQNKEKRSKDVHILPYKKRCTRIVSSPTDEDCVDDQDDHGHGEIKNPCFEDFYINLSKNLAFHRVFPQDEKEAAILLMALSCGLVHG